MPVSFETKRPLLGRTRRSVKLGAPIDLSYLRAEDLFDDALMARLDRRARQSGRWWRDRRECP